MTVISIFEILFCRWLSAASSDSVMVVFRFFLFKDRTDDADGVWCGASKLIATDLKDSWPCESGRFIDGDDTLTALIGMSSVVISQIVYLNKRITSKQIGMKLVLSVHQKLIERRCIWENLVYQPIRSGMHRAKTFATIRRIYSNQKEEQKSIEHSGLFRTYSRLSALW